MKDTGRIVCIVICFVINVIAFGAAARHRYDLAWQLSSVANTFSLFACGSWLIEEGK